MSLSQEKHFAIDEKRSSITFAFVMSVLEIKRVVEKLKPEERLFLLAYLKHLQRADSPGRKSQLGGRLRAMDAGKKIPLEKAVKIHEKMEEAGL